MKLAIKAELVYAFAQATQIIANIEASQSNDQTILSETLDIQPPIQRRSDKTSHGDRGIRASLSGEVTILYEAVVENNLRQLLRRPASSTCGRTSPATCFRSCCPAASVHRTSSCDLHSVNSAEPAMAWRG